MVRHSVNVSRRGTEPPTGMGRKSGAQERAADSGDPSSTSLPVRETTASLTAKVNFSGVPHPTPFEANQPGAADSLRKSHTQPIRAELRGSDSADALGIAATGNAPVLRLCRALVEAGHDPATRLEAWRGSTLCLRIRSIGEAARLVVKSAGNGAPVFAVGSQKGAGASPVAKTGQALALSRRQREANQRRPSTSPGKHSDPFT
jgi:hypothetical protein